MDTDFMIPEVHISTLGFRINGMCVVDFTVNLLFPVVAEVSNAQNVPSGNRTYVIYNYDVGRHLFNYPKTKNAKNIK